MLIPDPLRDTILLILKVLLGLAVAGLTLFILLGELGLTQSPRGILE